MPFIPSPRLTNFGIFLATVIAMATALWLQHHDHLEPCPLCIFQRVAMLALGVVGTGIAYVLNTNVVIGLGATAASTVTYLTPVVGVLLGVVVLGERVSWNEPVGGLVVILGVALGQGLLRWGPQTKSG